MGDRKESADSDKGKDSQKTKSSGKISSSGDPKVPFVSFCKCLIYNLIHFRSLEILNLRENQETPRVVVELSGVLL